MKIAAVAECWIDNAKQHFVSFYNLHHTLSAVFPVFSNFRRFLLWGFFFYMHSLILPTFEFSFGCCCSTLTNCVNCSGIRADSTQSGPFRWWILDDANAFLFSFPLSPSCVQGDWDRTCKNSVWRPEMLFAFKIHFKGEKGFTGREMTPGSVNTVRIYRASNRIMQIEGTVNPHWSKKKKKERWRVVPASLGSSCIFIGSERSSQCGKEKAY